MKHHFRISSALFAALLINATPSDSAGFGLIEQSASGMGNAFAGAAASAEDASTIFFNPAGMTYLPDNQLVVAAHAIKPSAEFTNNGSRTGVGSAMTGGNGGDAGDWALVPNIYFSKSVSNNVRLGIGVNAPFGLKTEYDNGWVGRYQALKSELKTININPSVSFKATDQLSLGLGFSAMRAEAKLTNAVDFGTICQLLTAQGRIPPSVCNAQGLLPQAKDGSASIKGDDWSWGWNAGAMFQATPSTRIGLSYRSQVHQNLEGSVGFGNVPAMLAGSFPNGSVTAKLTTPDSASASIFHKLNNQWDLMADLTWTHWSKFKDLTVIRSTATVLNSQPENWDNTARLSLGANYRVNDALKLRAGYAFDESPVSDTYRTPRIPDNDRHWVSVGGNYKFSPSSSLDVGYTHIFVKDASLLQGTVPSSTGKLIGDYDSDVNILSLQFTQSF